MGRRTQLLLNELNRGEVSIARLFLLVGSPAIGIPQISPDLVVVRAPGHFESLLEGLDRLLIEALRKMERADVGVDRCIGENVKRLLELGGSLRQVSLHVVRNSE